MMRDRNLLHFAADDGFTLTMNAADVVEIHGRDDQWVVFFARGAWQTKRVTINAAERAAILRAMKGESEPPY